MLYINLLACYYVTNKWLNDFTTTDLSTRWVDSYVQVESGKIIILIIVIFMDCAISQYPHCVDVTCPDGE